MHLHRDLTTIKIYETGKNTTITLGRWRIIDGICCMHSRWGKGHCSSWTVFFSLRSPFHLQAALQERPLVHIQYIIAKSNDSHARREIAFSFFKSQVLLILLSSFFILHSDKNDSM
jgi:hypothetical protein